MQIINKSISILFLLIFSLCFVSCQLIQNQSKSLNVLLITLDTTRADRLSCYGYSEKTTPFLDELVSKGAYLFENCIAEVPITLPSHTCMLTGQYPLAHGVRDNGLFRLSDSTLTLAEIFKEKGYQTAAFIAAFPLDSRYNLNQGFDTYDDDYAANWTAGDQKLEDFQAGYAYSERPADQVNMKVFPWLRKNHQKPFFLWVHYFDPHQPYTPPAAFQEKFKDPYDGEIAFCDSQIKALLDELMQLGHNQDTLIVIAGDHGQGLGEHGELAHAIFLYDSTMKVPFIIYDPTQLFDSGNHRIKEVCQLVDIMPTILDLLGFSIPEKCQGQSLKATFKGQTLPPRAAYLESYASWIHYNWSVIWGVRNDKYKYIRAPHPELYDLQVDPGETVNIYPQEQQIALKLDQQLQELIDRNTDPAAWQSSKFMPDFESREKLLALGYVQSVVIDKPPDISKNLRDPKDGQRIIDAITEARNLFQNGLFTEGMSLLKRLHEEDPTNHDLVMMIGQSYLDHGYYQEAYEATKDAALKFPQRAPILNLFAGKSLFALGRYEEAANYFKKGLEAGDVEIVNLATSLGPCLEKLDKNEEAINIYLKGLEKDPSNLDLRLNLANCYAKTNQNKKALEIYKITLQSNPGNPRIYYNIGIFYVNNGNLEEGVNQLNQALRIMPNYQQAHFSLAILYQQKQDLEAAKEHFQEANQINPNNSIGQKASEILQEITTNSTSSGSS